MLTRLFIRFCIGFLLTGSGLAADPVEDLKSFSIFKEVDIPELAEGELLVKGGEAMDFPRGISAEACSVVMAAPDKTAKRFRTWDPASHKELNVFFHGPVQWPPAGKDFKPLEELASKSSTEWLIKKTRTTTSQDSDLFLSLAEAVRLAKRVGTDGNSPESFSQCWSEILSARALKFQKEGLKGTPLYETEKPAVAPGTEIRNLLDQSPKVKARFAPLITAMFSGGKSGEASPFCYWELLEIDDHPVFNLGAIRLRAVEGRYQIMDCTYYSSSEIYASCTLREIWPIKIHDQPASLVWRGEFVSAPSLVGKHGVERMAAAGLMQGELKKAVRAFQADAAKAP